MGYHLSAVVKRRLCLCFLVLSLVSIRPAFPYSDSQFKSVTNENEQAINEIREKEIVQLKIVLGRRMQANRKPDILLRLAELYTEKYRFYFLKENEIYQKQLSEGLKPKRVDHEKSLNMIHLSKAACEAILKSKVHFNKMDQVYYFLGYNLQELGRKKDSDRYFRIIADKYPKSVFAPEAYRTLGDNAFDNKKYKEAVFYYEKAARYTNVPSYSKTLYQLAWAYFKTRRRSDAVRLMKQVIEQASDKYVGLKDEGLNDLVLFYSEAGKFGEAKAYFSRISDGDERYLQALSKLSRLLEKKGDYKLALQTNEGLINEHASNAPQLAFELMSRNVEMYKKLRNSKGERAEMERMVNFYLKNRSEIDKDQDSLALFIRIKNFVRSQATDTHKLAQKKKKTALFSSAADLYAKYLTTFLADPETDQEKKEAAEVKVYRVDCLIAANRVQEATPELEKLFEDGGSDKIRKEAGASLLNIKIKKLDTYKGTAPEDVEESFFDFAEKFEDQFPNDPLSRELYFKKKKYKLQKLIDKKQHDDALELAKEIVADPKFLAADKDKKGRKFAEDYISRSQFESAQNLEKDGSYEDAAKKYEDLAKQSSGEVAFKSKFNAAVNYEKAGQIENATKIYFGVLGQYQNGSLAKHVKDNLKKIAMHRILVGEYKEAVKMYSEFSSRSEFSKNEQASFLKTAVILAIGSKEKDSIERLARIYTERFCSLDQKTCDEVIFDYADYEEENNENEVAENILKNYPKKGTRQAESELKRATLFEKMGDKDKASQIYRELARHKKSSNHRENNFLAHAAFIEVEPRFKHFQSLKLELPEVHLKSVTQKKLGELEALVGLYQRVVGYGDGEWAIAALERLSDLFLGFAQELEGAPVPPSLNGKALVQYKNEIRTIAQALTKRAIDFLRQGYKKGIDLEVTTPTFLNLTQRLAARGGKEVTFAHFSLKNVVAWNSESLENLEILGGNIEDSSDERKKIASELEKNPKSAEAWIRMGNLELKKGSSRLALFFYNQALSIESRNTIALNNKAVIDFTRNDYIEAIQGLKKAATTKGASLLVQVNYLKALLAFHHFRSAHRISTRIAANFSSTHPGYKNAQLLHAIAALGDGEKKAPGLIFNRYDAKSSENFSVWYNWAIWSKDREILDDRKDSLLPLEKSQVELFLRTQGR
ncbi:MAG: tetratricopeptide repeat protein [Bacteriovoracia bacterium]